MHLLALLIAMLAVGRVGGIEVKADVWGVLECNRPFYAKVTLLEVDGGLLFGDDEFADPQARISTDERPAPSDLHDQRPNPPVVDNDGVEPRLVIKHTCGGGEHWICKDYGKIKRDFHVTENVKLNNATDTALKQFYNCDADYER